MPTTRELACPSPTDAEEEGRVFCLVPRRQTHNLLSPRPAPAHFLRRRLNIIITNATRLAEDDASNVRSSADRVKIQYRKSTSSIEDATKVGEDDTKSVASDGALTSSKAWPSPAHTKISLKRRNSCHAVCA